jgi:hypothetical protein
MKGHQPELLLRATRTSLSCYDLGRFIGQSTLLYPLGRIQEEDNGYRIEKRDDLPRPD